MNLALTFDFTANWRAISLEVLILILNFLLVLSGLLKFMPEFVFLGVSLLKTIGSW